MGLIGGGFGRVLRQLLPPGRLFTEDPDSNLQTMLDGLAVELDRVDEIACELPRELDPSEGLLSLTDWERVLQLPDGCGPTPVTIEERRRAVLGRLQSGGLLSRAFYRQLARSQGYRARIEELEAAPFRVGLSRCGDSLGTEAGVFAWTLVVDTDKRRPFRVGASRCGEALVSLADPLLECIIRRAAPAHTSVGFRYNWTGKLPGDTNPNTGPITDECWWSVEVGPGAFLRLLTQAGKVIVYSELGATLDLGLRDGAIPVLDENGVELEIPILCELAESCYLPLRDELDQLLRWTEQAGVLSVGTDAGPLALSTANHQVQVLDEAGEVLSLNLSCEEVDENWWRIFDPASGGYLNISTIDGELYARLSPTETVGLGVSNATLPVLDEDQNPLSIPLTASPA